MNQSSIDIHGNIAKPFVSCCYGHLNRTVPVDVKDIKKCKPAPNPYGGSVPDLSIFVSLIAETVE